jgi:mono/diheme cytochrome c family protein
MKRGQGGPSASPAATVIAGALILTVLPVTTAPAQQIGSRGRGLEVARQLCVECHAVESDDARSPNPDAPTFPSIAAVPGMTALALTAALNTSHRSMPNILLPKEEQANLIAYILSLK